MMNHQNHNEQRDDACVHLFFAAEAARFAHRTRPHCRKGERCTSSSNRGFTVLELLFGIGIFGILVAGAAAIMITSIRSNDVIWEQLATQNDGRRVLREVADDVRRAETSSIGSYPIESAATSSFVFFANIDADSARERVRFFLEDETLKKGTIHPTGVPIQYQTSTELIVEIAHDVKNASQGNVIFSYFDEDYTGTQSPLPYPINVTDIRVVRVQLELEEDPTQTPVPLHVETTVHIRNAKTN